MNFIYENSKKYVDINYVAEFLEYKRINTFISNCLKKATTTIKEFYIEVKEVVILLINNKRSRVAELINIMLTETQQKEINEIVDEFNEITNNKFDWVGKSNKFPKYIAQMWYIISSKNINIITEDKMNTLLNIFNIKEIEAIEHIYSIMEYDVINKGDDCVGINGKRGWI